MAITKIALWSGPRNISTAMMYSFGNRKDTTIVDEPLFGYFLKHTGAWRPSRDEVLSSMEQDPSKVIKELSNPNIENPVYFMKHMANHLIDLDWSVLKNFKNILLTRDPKDMLLSYYKHMENPSMLDTGYQIQLEILNYLIDHKLPFIVLDAKQVLESPEHTMRKLCNELAIPFTDDMIKWEAGPRKEDGIWAKYWYRNVHNSTSFTSYSKKEEDLPDSLIKLYEACLNCYKDIIKFKMK